MTTTISYSERGRFFGLCRSTFRRNIGYFGLLCTIIFVFYPLQYAMEAFKSQAAAYATLSPGPENLAVFATNPYSGYHLFGLGMNFTAVSAICFTFIMLIAPVVLALVLSGYLHSKKAADVFHALPVRRESLLGANFAVAMGMLWTPVVVSNLFISLVQLVKFDALPDVLGWLWMDTLGWFAVTACIYMITTLVAVCVGTGFDTFAFAGTLLAAAPVMMGLYVALSQEFLCGFDVQGEIMHTICLLSPATLMPSRFAFETGYGNYGLTTRNASEIEMLTQNNLAIFVYLLLAAALFFVAVKLYRRRPSESAEMTTSRGWLQVLVKLIGTVVCAVCTGFVFFYIGDGRNTLNFLVWAVVGGLLAYAIIEVILNRGFKSLLHSLPLGLCMTLAALIVPVVLMTGGLGYETRVPAADQVESVKIGYRGRFTNSVMEITGETNRNGDPRSFTTRGATLAQELGINAVRDFHAGVAEDGLNGRYISSEQLDSGVVPVSINMGITYNLKNGRTLTRYYGTVDAKWISLLLPLETDPEFLSQRHPAFFTDPANIYEWKISDPFGGSIQHFVLSQADNEALLEAMRQDLLTEQTEDLTYPERKLEGYLEFHANLPKVPTPRAAHNGSLPLYAGKNTYRLAQERGWLEQIKPDMSKCYAVAVEWSDSGNGRYRNNDTAVLQMEPEYASFNVQDLQYQRENIKQELQNWRHEADMIGVEEFLSYDYRNVWAIFEDPAEIRTLSENIVGSWATGEPVLYAQFYFEGMATGNTLMIPLSRLPQELKQQFDVGWLLENGPGEQVDQAVPEG